ncbi:MAG TPA: hypothetical protein VIJ28_11190 [Chloroflexota bacterium]|jgi:hypothetical protein
MNSLILPRALAGAPRTIRDRGATVLLIACALGALYACASSIGDVAAAGPATQQVELWRLLGFAMFTGVFGLLAVWPRRYPGLWELVIVNKAALTIAEAVLIGNHAANAKSTAIADGILTVLLVAAYFLARGWGSWNPGRMGRSPR